MAKSTTPKVRKNRQAKRETLAGYLFLLTNFIGCFVFTAVPIVAGLVLSFTDFNGFKASFVGLDNYAKFFRDSQFQAALVNNLIYSALSVPLTVICALALAMLIGGAAAAQETMILTDDLGRSVTIERRPQCVAALIGSFADIWCLAGGADALVAAADDTFRKFDLPISAETINLGATKDISLEKLLAAQPQLVIASCSTAEQVALEPVLSQMGLNTVYFDVDSFEDYLRMLRVCTQITGCEENYARYGEDVQAQVDAARARADGSRPTVLYVRATGSSCRVKGSEGSVLGEMLAAMDCANIADSEESLLENLSIEAILEADPDFIFVVEQSADPDAAKAVLHKTLFSNPAWQTLTAVREGRVHVMDGSLFNLNPNSRWGEAYEQLAEILYGQK